MKEKKTQQQQKTQTAPGTYILYIVYSIFSIYVPDCKHSGFNTYSSDQTDLAT